MKVLYFFTVGFIISISSYAQSTLPLRADTVTIEKVGGNATLKIKNATRDSVGGVLYNIGGGVTGFKKSKKVTDSTIVVGGDTLLVGGNQNLQSVTDKGARTTNILLTKKQLYTPRIGSDSIGEVPFEIIVLPDLQGMTLYFPWKLRMMFDWIVANKVTENIQSVFTVGDLTQTNTTPEWDTIRAELNRVDALNIPYLPVIGNHDYDNALLSGRIATEFNTYFGPSSFAGKPWYAGNFGGSNENYYLKYQIGSYKILVLALEFLPQTAAINWAKTIIESNSDYKVIISTHAHLTPYGERSMDTSAHSVNHYNTTPYPNTNGGNNGQYVWDNLIKKYSNIVMVLNGHFITGTPAPDNRWVRRMTDVGDSNNVVHQIFINYQRDSVGGIYPENGQGWLMKLRLDPSNGNVYESVYSPYLGIYDSRVDSFNIGIPGIAVKNDASFEGAYVKKELRVDNGLFLGNDIPKFSIPYVGESKKIMAINGASYNSLLTVPNLAVTDLTADRVALTNTSGRIDIATSFRYIHATNRIGINMSGLSGPDKPLDVRGSMGVNASSTSAYRSSFQAGLSATLTIQHSTSNWGLNISRCDAFPTSGANLSFYHSNNSNPDVKSPIGLGGVIARISFQSPRQDTSNVAIYGDILGKVGDTTSGLPGMDIVFSMAEGSGNTANHKFGFLRNGNFNISDNAGVDNGFKLWVKGSIGQFKDSNILMSGITSQNIALYDTVDQKYKRIRVTDLLSGGLGSGTAGQAAFWTGASTQSGDNNFFWDNTNKRLGLGTNTPSRLLSLNANSGPSLLSMQLNNVEYFFYGVSASTDGIINGSVANDGVIRTNNTKLLFSADGGNTANYTINTSGNSLFNTAIDNSTGTKVQVNGGISISGGNYHKVTNITSNTTIGLTEYFITIDATGGNVTITLPAASTAFASGMGIVYQFKRLDNSGNTITIQRAGSDTVDGGTSFTLSTQWEAKGLQCASTSTWLIK